MPHPGALPVYQQVSELLSRDIASGRLADGERLPPEREMARDLSVSVGTLRAALAELGSRGMLHRVQGSGNYVRAQADTQAVYAFFRLELARGGGGGLPTAEVLSVDRLPKDDALPPFGRDAEGHRIRRLRFLSGQPAAVEEIWLDGALVPRIAVEDLSESLYLFYRTRLDLWIARAEDRVGMGQVPDWAPDAFAPRALVPKVTRVSSRASDGAAVEASWTWFDPDIAAYVARLR